MSRGKYSVLAYKRWPAEYEYKYNCYGEEPEQWKPAPYYNSLTMFDNYDEDGYDKYGYSAFDLEGNFTGHGDGIDRAGYTEMDYLTLQDIPEEHRGSYYYYNS